VLGVSASCNVIQGRVLTGKFISNAAPISEPPPAPTGNQPGQEEARKMTYNPERDGNDRTHRSHKTGGGYRTLGFSHSFIHHYI